MGVTVRNAVVQNGSVTVASAHFVAAQGLSREAKVAALAALTEHAAQCLDLPHEGPQAAEILYQIADHRAGAAPLKTPEPPAPPQPAKPQGKLAKLAWQAVLLATAAFVAGAFIADMAGGIAR
jgi:hypothetical protein